MCAAYSAQVHDRLHILAEHSVDASTHEPPPSMSDQLDRQDLQHAGDLLSFASLGAAPDGFGQIFADQAHAQTHHAHHDEDGQHHLNHNHPHHHHHSHQHHHHGASGDPSTGGGGSGVEGDDGGEYQVEINTSMYSETGGDASGSGGLYGTGAEGVQDEEMSLSGGFRTSGSGTSVGSSGSRDNDDSNTGRDGGGGSGGAYAMDSKQKARTLGKRKLPKPSTQSDLDHRKFLHKEIERKRRENINNGLNALVEAIPQLAKEKHKGKILEKAVEYIRALQSRVPTLEERVNELQLQLSQQQSQPSSQSQPPHRRINEARPLGETGDMDVDQNASGGHDGAAVAAAKLVEELQSTNQALRHQVDDMRERLEHVSELARLVSLH